MPKQRGFQPQGYINPLVIARANAKPRTGPSLIDYMNRPRPSMDEFKQMVAEKDKKHAALELFDEMQTKNFRQELDKYRKDMHKRQERKEKEQRKKDKKEKKKKKKRKHSSSDDSSSESDSKSKKKRKHSSDSDSDDKARKKEKKEKEKNPMKLSEFFKQSED